MPSKKRFIFYHKGKAFHNPQAAKEFVELHYCKLSKASKTGAAIIKEIEAVFKNTEFELGLVTLRDKPHYRKSRRPYVLLRERTGKKPKAKTLPSSQRREIRIPTHIADEVSPSIVARTPSLTFQEIWPQAHERADFQQAVTIQAEINRQAQQAQQAQTQWNHSIGSTYTTYVDSQSFEVNLTPPSTPQENDPNTRTRS